MDAIFDGDYYSEREKVNIATRTFDDDTFEWWEVERHCRRFYGDRPVDTWYELTEILRKRLRQNIDEELRAGMDKIDSLFSQWKESSPNPDKVSNFNEKTPQKEESVEMEHAGIQKLEESLSENMEIEEDDAGESKDFNQDFLVEDDEDQQQSEVVYLLSCKNVIFIVHTSPTVILVSLMFQPLYTVSMRGETELMRRKKKKKKRNGKRVKEKLFVLDIFQVTMARI